MWREEIGERMRRLDAQVNAGAGRMHSPRSTADLNLAIRAGHPHWVQEPRRAVRVALVGLGGEPVSDAMVEEARAACAEVGRVLLCRRLGAPPPDAPLPERFATEMVDRVRRAMDVDLVVVITDGSWGWPRVGAGQLLVCAAPGVEPPRHLGRSAIRIDARGSRETVLQHPAADMGRADYIVDEGWAGFGLTP
jgi:hypothetical protein